MSTLWSDHIAGLIPYTPGEQARIPNLLKLNTNENPYGPSPRAIEAMKAALSDDMRLYPDYQALGLRQAIARRYRLDADQVFLGNGSDEILAHVFNAFFLRGGRPLWLPDVTYSFYRTYCRFYDVPHHLIPLADDFTLRVSDYTQAAEQEPAGIIFANPNAPTGRALDLDAIAAIARARPDSAVVVDEAYVDFGAESAAALLRDFPNLLVVHTLSKSRSLAGLRVGYALASVDLVAGLLRVKDSFNSYPLDRVALAGAQASIEDEAWFDQTRHAVMDARESLTQDLQSLGFDVLPSQANFVFARHRGQDAGVIARGLREQGILVRHFQAPRIEQYLRITVGTPEQCARLCDTLKAVLSA
ncbi:histidinol-phosphate transaminase [uncultured Castellaniella sp.]|uniref:histidinol-phosphate transaminase n=1 Tax=uncultured Castellaniella sp. TaxID=647907 RepID=UPI00263443BC|nr:histidinol-phosphate transaminase [uncultured Castellaniella sp.]